MKFATLALIATAVSAQLEDEAAQEVVDALEEEMLACADCAEDETMTCGTVTISTWSKEGCQQTDLCNTKSDIEDSEMGTQIEITCSAAKLFATAAATFGAIAFAMWGYWSVHLKNQI